MKSSTLSVVSVSVCAVIALTALLSWFSFSRVRKTDREIYAKAIQGIDRDWVAASNLYSRLVSKLVAPNVPSYDEYLQPLSRIEGTTGCRIYSDYMGENVSVERCLHFMFNRKTSVPVHIYNKRLIDYVNTNAVQHVPGLSMAEAVEKAKHYLNLIGVPLATNMVLKGCIFNDSHYRHSWSIGWEPTAGGYPYDTVMEPYVQYVGVIFHEQYGFLKFSMHDYWPSPESTEVRVTREEALAKAEAAAPLVFRSDMFLARNVHSNYKVRTVEEIALRVYLPNWAHDPKRAIWGRDAPPSESRLCWMIHFITVDTQTGKTGDPIRGNPQYVWIYVDAATGEVVGANFT
ncbi:MAG: hypothetical protein FWG50_14090 [Kiritimatiellaeota bacterium]|nr:hypothetical protein [Kiritimatiellota bacterium]